MFHSLNLFQWIVVPIAAVLFLQAVASMARGGNWRSAGIRALFCFAAGTAVLWPGMTMTLAKLLGIGRGTDLVLYIFIFGFLVAAFYFYSRVVKLESAITTLVRQSALKNPTQTKG